MPMPKPAVLRLLPIPAFAILALTLAGCGNDVKPDESVGVHSTNPRENIESATGHIEGDNGILGMFDSSRNDKGGPANGIGVNAYLWRASLDTVSFMPLASADPFGGVIITDWYTPPQTPNERFKINLYILDRELRADAVRTSIFRQTRGADGRWSDAAVDPKMTSDFENAILTRARQLRVASVEAAESK